MSGRAPGTVSNPIPETAGAAAARPAPRRALVLSNNAGGGTGNHLLSMIEHWSDAGWETVVITQNPPRARVSTRATIEVLSRRRWFHRSLLGHIANLRHLAAYVRAFRPDVVHAYFFWPIVYARILKRWGKIEVLIENREDLGFSWGRREYALLRLTRSLPDRIICVADAVRRVVLERERIEPSRVTVVHNGAPAVPRSAGASPERTELRARLGLSPEHTVVGMVANFNRAVKGVAYLLDAVPSIVARAPSARFLLLGRGKEERSLRARAKALGIEEYVIFGGYQAEIHAYYGIMDVSVLTSLSEGLSLTLLESMAHGLPVVATEVGGNPEVVADGETGFLVPPRDVPAFADRVVHLLTRPDLRARMGEAARRRVRDDFQIRAAAERYLRLYDAAMRETAG